VSDHALVLLDTSCVIEYSPHLDGIAETAAISTLTVAELADGLHHGDPLVTAAREERYREVLSDFDPARYSANAAHLYVAIAATVRKSGGTLDHAGST
jgi:predicted nucleic acid-binding protein